MNNQTSKGNTNNTSQSSVEVPAQWPPEVRSEYEPVRRLGKGGFASVVLAKKKSDGSYAAMKVVGRDKLSKQEYGYAHREIDILNEISHPHIMKLLAYWEPKGGSVVMALSYASGPTLDHLLKLRGAVSFTFGRVIMAQLLDALAYLHSRAVIHRDIKPDNVVITGATADQTEIWKDPTDKEERTYEDWQDLCKKWHITLVDFGFARALTPQDVDKENVAIKKKSIIDANASRHSSTTNSKHRSISVSRHLTRRMSALGNRFYAAPEIMEGVQSRHGGSNHSLGMSQSQGKSGAFDITQTISHHVANYGMLADAYSLGNTFQYMMTGVSPDQDVNEMINLHNSPIATLCRFIAKLACSKGSKDTDYQYRGWGSIPKDMKRLIRGLNHPNVGERTSIRASRRYPLIEAVLDDPNAEQPEEAVYHKLNFLPCAMKKKNELSPEQTKDFDEKVMGAGAEEKKQPVEEASPELPVVPEQ